MKRVIDSSEALGTVGTPQGTLELCVTAQAGFDEKTRELIVQLQSFLRPANLLAHENHTRAAWMPADSTVIEKVDWSECPEVAREIFQRWAHKVREAAPQLHRL